MNIDSQIMGHRIIVIQSLQQNDKKTGSELFHDILQYKEYYQNDTFSKFYEVKNKEDFLSLIHDICESIIDGETVTLHFETHGDEKGVILQSKEIISWEEFDNAVRPINIKTMNLLIVVMAMCKGGALLSHIDPEQRSPYLAFVGSVRDVNEEEIIESFHAFYSNYNSPFDVNKAMNCLRNYFDSVDEKAPFGCFSSEYIFDNTFDVNRDEQYYHWLIELYCYKKYGDCIDRHLECTEKEIQDIFNHALAQRDYFLFKDVYK